MITGRKKTLKAHMGEGAHPIVRLPETEEKVEVIIDGHRIEVPRGTTILEAALSGGIDIPYFCFHPGLSPEGNCRMCLVELEGRPKLEPSCILPVSDGLVVSTDTPAVKEARRGVMEFLLLNHPLDCPWCDKAGECMLQDNSYKHGPGTARHQMAKRTYPVKEFSAHLKMYMNRCIHCTRCVRFLREVEGKEEFSLYQRGAYVDVGTYIEHNLSNNYQGCLADVCPVGALVTKPFLYRARVFDLEAQASVCAMCSAGCSIYVDRKQNLVARFRPRPNLLVNEWWMCDQGRFGWEWIERDRLNTPLIGVREGEAASESDWTEALEAARAALSEPEEGKAVAGICSATASCEEVHLFDRLMRELAGSRTPWYGPDGRVDPHDKLDFLRRRDPNPNTRGLEAILEDLHPMEMLRERIAQGAVGTLLVVGTTLDEDTARMARQVPNVVVIASHQGPATEASTVALPGVVWLEKEGTFVNGNGHLQRFLQALDITTAARPDVLILSALIAACGFGEAHTGPGAIFAEMARERMPFIGLSYETIPSEGVGLAQATAGTDDSDRKAETA